MLYIGIADLSLILLGPLFDTILVNDGYSRSGLKSSSHVLLGSTLSQHMSDQKESDLVDVVLFILKIMNNSCFMLNVKRRTRLGPFISLPAQGSWLWN